jgi:hypothetical protein
MIKKIKYTHDFVTGSHLPVINLNMVSVEVVGGVRPLNVAWTPELAQDLTAYHNIDAEAELTNLLAENLAQEIDNEILQEIRGMIPIETPDPIQPTRNVLTVDEVTEQIRQTRVQEELRRNTVDKWSSLGFLDGLQGQVRENLETLYENQATTLINENPEPTNNFDTVTFPIVRRVFARTLGHDIVGYNPVNYDNTVLNGLDGNHDLPQGVEVNWRTDDTWTYENLYGSIIGVYMEMKKHEFVIDKRIRSIFDQVDLPRVNRRFV